MFDKKELGDLIMTDRKKISKDEITQRIIGYEISIGGEKLNENIELNKRDEFVLNHFKSNKKVKAQGYTTTWDLARDFLDNWWGNETGQAKQDLTFWTARYHLQSMGRRGILEIEEQVTKDGKPVYWYSIIKPTKTAESPRKGKMVVGTDPDTGQVVIQAPSCEEAVRMLKDWKPKAFRKADARRLTELLRKNSDEPEYTLVWSKQDISDKRSLLPENDDEIPF